MDSEARLDKLRVFMDEKGMDLSVIVDPLNQYYMTGFYAIIYSRPIITLVFPDSVQMIVPALEELHAREESAVDDIHVYYEHPEKASISTDPNEILCRLIDEKSRGRVGVERDSVPLSLCQRIEERSGAGVEDVGAFIREMRLTKDEEELDLIRKAAELADLGVVTSIEATRPGVSELEIDAAGNSEILKAAAERFPGARLDLFVMSPSSSPSLGPSRRARPSSTAVRWGCTATVRNPRGRISSASRRKRPRTCSR